ncbi:anti-sigma factor family protein [Kangiella shandongensis]|uniref:anti-sigma factor family protein n=1 Tax=Kangiella shandongensis TaxID=2763258 RepID=UPI001CC0157C|nr:hypothetical protein [Kangiella shandongensis]
MTISDEKLCAFIDNELSHDEMNAIRDRIAEDESLTDRIAELNMLDHSVRSTIHAIDEKPVPAATERLLQQSETQAPSDNVVSFPLWRRVKQTVREHAAIAAVLVLALGLTVGTYFTADKQNNELAWSEVAQLLDTAPSGQSAALNSSWEIFPKASFKNKSDHYCRIFALSSGTTSHMNIACQQNGSWQLHSRMPLALSDPAQYQTASVDPALDKLVDSMIQGQFLNQEQESQAIEAQWKVH